MMKTVQENMNSVMVHDDVIVSTMYSQKISVFPGRHMEPRTGLQMYKTDICWQTLPIILVQDYFHE